MKTTVLVFAGSLAALAVPGAASGNSVDDDLEVVKKATSSGDSERATAEAPPRPRSSDGPQWFRVRIVVRVPQREGTSVRHKLGYYGPAR